MTDGPTEQGDDQEHDGDDHQPAGTREQSDPPKCRKVPEVARSVSAGRIRCGYFCGCLRPARLYRVLVGQQSIRVNLAFGAAVVLGAAAGLLVAVVIAMRRFSP